MQYNKFLSCWFFILIGLGACEQPKINHNLEIHKDSTFLDVNKGLVFYESKPFTGKMVTYHDASTSKSLSIQYKQGKKQGLSQKWYPNGKISYEAHYQNGKRHGAIKTWWKNGNLRSLASYEYGVVHGSQKQWYISGSKFKEMNYHKGKENGMQKAWRENGKLYTNYEAKGGRIYGLKRANLCYELNDETIQYKD